MTQSSSTILDGLASVGSVEAARGNAHGDAGSVLADPSVFRWFRPLDRSPLTSPDLSDLRYLTGRPHRGRYVMTGRLNGRPCLVKLRELSLRKRIPARIGHRFMRHEARMLAVLHEQTDLPTPEPYLLGEQMTLGLPARQGIVMALFADHVNLTHWLSGHPRRQNQAIDIMIDMMRRVREAGFGDADFNGNNVIIDPQTAVAGQPRTVWIDFERVWPSDPSSTRATAETIAAMLGWWWTIVSDSPRTYREIFERIRHELPKPHHGWANCMRRADRRIQQRFRRGKRQASPPPPPLPTLT